ncbi:Gfo/Idh/MocA family protein [Oerskovia merdavium]|uniref:Gfo/Idh/MocA family oxidoreductase n=1 Tax=Oerskovia merdavium TaxID=2762227 RepID=A0ABR8TVW8_9CELL|nr:Gfo/Idh/MocA family oxidoreductase [Oerskovia merdavium]MBD7979635.1 Gfo/Idh/MocA family oxidoreductase [Oerskovia merdavium]
MSNDARTAAPTDLKPTSLPHLAATAADLPEVISGVVPDPRTAPTVRWGILGAGNIAGSFAEAVRDHTRARVVAVGSRDRVRAERFATEHGIHTTHADYTELVEDPQVDVVYVATPHSHHRDHALLAIAAGKHVLVEKAFTRNEAEAREILDAARAAGVFVMEAMWTRFLPHVAALRGVIARGEIGEIVNVTADHGQFFPFDSAHRLYAPELAGGALLDLGVYPVSFAHDVLGAPSSVTAVGALTETGVDGQLGITLGYGRAMATLSTTLWSQTPNVASISGTAGRIEVEGTFYAPTSFRVVRHDGAEWRYEGFRGEGKQYQAAEVARCLEAGLTESPRMTWQDTLDVMRTMDEVRRQTGVVYPGE